MLDAGQPYTDLMIVLRGGTTCRWIVRDPHGSDRQVLNAGHHRLAAAETLRRMKMPVRVLRSNSGATRGNLLGHVDGEIADLWCRRPGQMCGSGRSINITM